MKLENKRGYLGEKGITLIALVVTIVVLLILAGVSVNAIFNENGLIKKAQEAQSKMDEAKNNDLEAIDELNKWIDNQVNGTTGETTPVIKTMTIKLGIRGLNGQGTYSYEEGMTWGEWIVSEYNTDGFRIVNNCICSSGSDGSLIPPSEVITGGEFCFGEIFSVIPTSETWVLNDAIPLWTQEIECSINFTSNGQQFTKIKITTKFGGDLYYDEQLAGMGGPGASGGMMITPEPGYEELTFETAPTGELLAWLQANATKQE